MSPLQAAGLLPGSPLDGHGTYLVIFSAKDCACVYTICGRKIWLVRQKCLTLHPNPDEEARVLSFN